MDPSIEELAQLAFDRSEIADTVYRYAFGLDHGDADSLASVFTEDCVFDFTPAATKLELNFGVLNGRDETVKTLIAILGALDTSHTPSNIQTEIDGDSATLHAYLLSQHFMPGDGPRRGTENALLMNRYDAELVREGQQWRFRRVVIDNAWAEGDPTILTALATLRATRSKAKRPQ
jgi:ketosteroid isomerase-like protein